MPSDRTPRPRRLGVVTLVAKAGNVGGGERIAAEIAKGLDPSRYESVLCITRPPSEREREVDGGFHRFIAELEQAGVRPMVLTRHSRWRLGAWVPLYRLLRSGDFPILHSHMFGSNVSGALLGRLAGIPVVIGHEHSWSFEGRRLRRLLDRHLIARFGDAHIAVSREDRRRMIEIEGIAPNKVVLVPNGIPASSSTADMATVRKELGLADDAPVIGTVGVLRPEKAIEVLIEATAALRPQFPTIQLMVIGPGGERPRLEALAMELGIGDAVRFLGRRLDVPDLLKSLDVAVCCSDREGFPLSVMEYMEAGAPVVATRVGGIPDMIENGVHGLLVPPRDPKQLATAIAALLQHPDRAAGLAERARERRLDELDAATMVRHIEALYESLYARKAAPGGTLA